MSSRTVPALLRLLALVSLLALPFLAAAGPRVLILGRSDDGVQAQVIAAMRSALEKALPDLDIELHAATPEGLKRSSAAAAVVTVGREAASLAASRPSATPMLHIMLPAAAVHALPARRSSPAAAIVLDQPPSRQLALLRLALPEMRDIALISSPAGDAAADQLQIAAGHAGLQVLRARISSDKELFAALEHVLPAAGILITTPDPVVFNRYTVHNILLTTFRRRSPVLGLSAAYVQAGALLGLYSTPAQVGEDAADAVREILSGLPLPPLSGPKRFEIGVNERVARALGLHLPSPDALTHALRRQEEGTP